MVFSVVYQSVIGEDDSLGSAGLCFVGINITFIIGPSLG